MIRSKCILPSINESKPSLIRIESDELTYPLHIMIRYEIEKALMNDEIEVKDLPKVWNDKYAEYLGIRPKNDREGCPSGCPLGRWKLWLFPFLCIRVYVCRTIQTCDVERVTKL